VKPAYRWYRSSTCPDPAGERLEVTANFKQAQIDGEHAFISDEGYAANLLDWQKRDKQEPPPD